MKLNGAAEAHASSLIKSGKVVKSSSWSGPSADKENAYIKAHGIGAYGKWYLGIDPSQDPTTKGHYHYPFSSNFEDVDYKGVIAIRQRSAQQGASDIFKATGHLVDEIEPKTKSKAHVEIIQTKAGLQYVLDFFKE